MTDDERAVRDVVERWMAATRAGDTASVLNLMTDDVVFMVPGRQPFGKTEFAAAAEGMKDLRVDGRADIQELRVLGDFAYVRNYIEVSVTAPNGATVRRAGYTLTIFTKETEGRWRLARDANLVTSI